MFVFCRVDLASHDSAERHIDHCCSHSIRQRRPRSQHCPTVQPHRALCGRQMDQGQPQANSQVIAYSSTGWHPCASAGSCPQCNCICNLLAAQRRALKFKQNSSIDVHHVCNSQKMSSACANKRTILRRSIASRTFRMCGTCSVLLAVYFLQRTACSRSRVTRTQRRWRARARARARGQLQGALA
jgi:hypothetical protein